MRGIICYDFSEDKARTRLVKILQKYGTRIQYSVFEFNLDVETWTKLVSNLHDKKFLTGNHNIIIIPISKSVHDKIIYLGNVFMAFDYDTMIYSGFGVKGIGEKETKTKYLKLKQPKSPRNRKKKIMTDGREFTKIEQNVLDKIFEDE